MIILAFGSFDGVHDGHISFLKQAAALGDVLIVGVARDEHIRLLKKRAPRIDEETRCRIINSLEGVHEAIVCDEHLGDFEIVRSTRPHLIALGWDQEALHKALQTWLQNEHINIPLVTLYKQERYDAQNMG